MKHDKISDRDRVWVVTRGEGGELRPEIDPELIAALHAGASRGDPPEALVIAAGSAEVAQTRIW